MSCRGNTLHAFAGLSVLRYASDFNRAARKGSKEKWEKVKVLIIDEISMIAGELLDRYVRGGFPCIVMRIYLLCVCVCVCVCKLVS